MGATLLVALVGSLAFGSTAIIILSSFGGASIQLFAPLAILFVLSTVFTRDFWTDLSRVFSLHWTPIIVVVLLVYVTLGFLFMPRLFAGTTTVFLPHADRIVETTLKPVSGNVNQGGYFAAGVFTYFALSIFLIRDGSFASVAKAFFLFISMHVSLGVVDLAGKMAGVGDILAPLRTAGYSMLVETHAEGFWRLVGSYPEASTFGSATLLGLAFSFTYWKVTGSRSAFALACALIGLLVLSTSTTAYVGLAVLTLILGLSIFIRGHKGYVTSRDIVVIACGAAGISSLVALAVFDEHTMNSFSRLLLSATVEKTESASAEERFYWNQKSWQAFVDTMGLGIGLGSSRASSWLFAVISQLGIIGSVLTCILVLQLSKLPLRATFLAEGRSDLIAGRNEIYAVCASMRSAGFTNVLTISISGASADPGIVFFIALATLLVGRARLAPYGQA
jgi:hypothetical protein